MNSIALVTDFFNDIQKEFSFLTDKHGFSGVHGFTDRRKGHVIIKPPPADLADITEPFVATYLFEIDGRDLKFTYDSDSHLLNCYVTYDQSYRVTLCDLHHLLTPARDALSQETTLQIPVESPDQMHEGIKALRYILESDLDTYLNPPHDFITMANASKNTIIDHLSEDPIEKLLDNDLEQARREACLAFEQGDYKRAIMLYRPHKDKLSEDDLEIFSLAFERLQE